MKGYQMEDNKKWEHNPPIINRKRTAKHLKCLMEWKHFKPKDIQEYLNLTCVQTVYRWLDGINIPSVDNLYALSQLFQVKVDDMLVGNRQPLSISNRQVSLLAAYYTRLRVLQAIF